MGCDFGNALKVCRMARFPAGFVMDPDSSIRQVYNYIPRPAMAVLHALEPSSQTRKPEEQAMLGIDVLEPRGGRLQWAGDQNVPSRICDWLTGFPDSPNPENETFEGYAALLTSLKVPVRESILTDSVFVITAWECDRS